MSDLIDRDTVLRVIDGMFPAETKSEYQKGIAAGLALAKLRIAATPAETERCPKTVTCEDCLHNYGSKHNPMCDFVDAHLWPDSFCSYGKEANDE